jgi:16S rRNA (cytosine967-C5)-methyltransferase
VGFEYSKIFPWEHLLSKGIDKEAFAISFLTQPDLFLRVRPGKKSVVQDKLDENGIHYTTYDDACIAMPNSTKIDELLEIDKEVVVQDRSSQKTGTFLKLAAELLQSDTQSDTSRVWDCCAASGGKSILAFDLLKNIDLTVSDIRPSIINNLRERFNDAGVNGYTSFVADLTDNNTEISSDTYDLIIADVPCSGSGTWARTPEQLYFFKEEKINYYSNLQKKILAGVIPSIKPGGALLYITCSVFEGENEEAVKFVIDNYGLNLVKMELISGYNEKADTLFAALFTN